MSDYYPTILRNWIYPLAQKLHKRNYTEMMRDAQRIQYLEREQLRRIQFAKLKALLHHSYQTVPYYRDRYKQAGLEPDDIRSLDDLKLLPILQKDEIRNDHKRFLSEEPRTPVFKVSTSGSTGIPMEFHISQSAAAAANISRIRALEWWGIKLGDRELRFGGIGYPMGSGIKIFAKKHLIKLVRYRIMNRRTLSAFDMSPQSMDDYWDFIQKFSPKYFFGYPSSFHLFAQYLKKQGYDGKSLGLRCVVVTGEILFDWQVQEIEDVFNCPVANEYGSVEVGVMAYGYPCGTLHTMDDFVLFEIVKSNPNDEVGEIVVTHLENWGSPLIRYNVQDLAIPLDDPSPCSHGLGFQKIKRVIGRYHDLIRLQSGRIVHGTYFEGLMREVVGVQQYQVIQKKTDLFEILVVSDEEFTTEQEDFIRDKINLHLENARVEIKRTQSISKEASGKLRYVRSEVK
jgi:phenylacetate-CoA ligase